MEDRNTERTRTKLTSDLNNLFDTSDAKTLEIIKIEERTFLLSQREPPQRVCLYGNRYEACKACRKGIIDSQENKETHKLRLILVRRSLTIAWVHQENRQASRLFMLNLDLHQLTGPSLPRCLLRETKIRR
ncbi:hypothetical protein AVEN_225982-1 [Araneus ventricosus]|uniref:Uncharacterized protein n=1 Tax=Araneus ventricosus TaxID=182803 RepID=A0A4Y2TTC5_ARAVE|nr:hypothetical protein AVEN_225982-1 [Araneus ventricosus]